MSEKKYTCKDCKYYKPIDETRGDCFGHEIPADMPVEQCPTKPLSRKVIKMSMKINYTKKGLKNIRLDVSLDKIFFTSPTLELDFLGCCHYKFTDFQ